ncbi:TPA: hypothetical protein ACS70L_003318 [Providencia alcalifaciens]
MKKTTLNKVGVALSLFLATQFSFASTLSGKMTGRYVILLNEM